jgi:hypothetical protein
MSIKLLNRFTESQTEKLPPSNFPRAALLLPRSRPVTRTPPLSFGSDTAGSIMKEA